MTDTEKCPQCSRPFAATLVQWSERTYCPMRLPRCNDGERIELDCSYGQVERLKARVVALEAERNLLVKCTEVADRRLGYDPEAAAR